MNLKPEMLIRSFNPMLAWRHLLCMMVCFLPLGALVAQTARSHAEQAQKDLRANRPEEAAAEFRAILKLDPRNAEAHANLGLIAFAGGNYQESSHELRAALNIRPSLWNAQAFLGMSEMHLGSASEAQRSLEQAFDHLQEPHLRIRAGTALVQLDYELGKLENALSVAGTLERLAPDDPDVLYLAYRTHAALAARALSALAKAAPGSARLHEVLAESHASDYDYAGAIAEYEKALAIDPALPGLHFELGQAILRNHVDQASENRAQEQFEAALKENPNDAHAEYEMGEIRSLQANWPDSLKHYARAVQLRPDLVDAQIGMGKVLIRLGKPDEALQYLQQAARLDPENETAHYRLAQVYRALKNDEAAQREMQTFLALHKSQDAGGTDPTHEANP